MVIWGYCSLSWIQQTGSTPKGYSHIINLKIQDQTAIAEGAERALLGLNPARDRFLKKKIPQNLDVIVIGSGIGGLSCAGFLSRIGKRCLVLEQHYIAGGCTHTFEEHGLRIRYWGSLYWQY